MSSVYLLVNSGSDKTSICTQVPVPKAGDYTASMFVRYPVHSRDIVMSASPSIHKEINPVNQPGNFPLEEPHLSGRCSGHIQGFLGCIRTHTHCHDHPLRSPISFKPHYPRKDLILFSLLPVPHTAILHWHSLQTYYSW